MTHELVRPGDSVLVALGGNALVAPGERVTIASQSRNAARAMRALVPLVADGCRLVVTHGNGFQVGNILLRAEEALGKAYPIPLEVCVAESQGEIGYLVEQALQNELARHGLAKPVVSVLTQVVVEADDPAFAAPTKPIGPWFTSDQAERLRQHGFAVAEEPGRGWRKVVASPTPVEIDDVEIVHWLLERDVIVIAAGGGGIPVVRGDDGLLRGVPAVIDKDLASTAVALGIGARHMLILTDVPCVYRDFASDRQEPILAMTDREAERLLGEGEFPPGSMGPKIEAAIRFVRGGGESVVITDADHVAEAMRGSAGTTLTRAQEAVER